MGNVDGATYDYGFRIYDSRIAKFTSVDPLTKSYPWYTPYQFAGNTPIWKIDLDGLEKAASKANNEDSKDNKVESDNLEIIAKDINKYYQQFLQTQKEDANNNEDKKETNNVATVASQPGETIDKTIETVRDVTAVTGVLTNIAKAGTDKLIKGGFWIGKTKTGLVLYSQDFYGNQYVVRSNVRLLKLSKSVKVAGVAVSAIAVSADVYNYVTAAEGKQKEEALNELTKNLIITGVTVLNVPVGLTLSLIDYAVTDPEVQKQVTKDLYNKSLDYYNRGNYNAWKFYQKRTTGNDPCPCFFKQGYKK